MAGKMDAAVAKKAAGVLAGVLILCYLGYQLYIMNYRPVSTQLVLEYTAYEAIANVELLAVRDESYLVNTASGGAVLPIAGDGSRVAKDDNVALVFENAEAASSYARIQQLQREIAHYQSLETKKNAHTINVDGIDQQIRQDFSSCLAVIDSGRLDQLSDHTQALCDSITGRQLATGVSMDFNAKIAALTTELAALQAALPRYQPIPASGAGYYISGVDGYENTVDYDAVDSLTVTQVQQALAAAPSAVPENVIGRIVNRFNWYFICCVDETKLVRLYEDTEAGKNQIIKIEAGDTVTVKLYNSAADEIKAQVESIHDSKDGQTVLVLRCARMDESIAALRKEQADIRLASHTGYKVNSRAVRFNEDGEMGVYVLRGNQAYFKRIDVVYTGSDFVVASNVSDKNELRLYDEVIVEGKNLEDGKIVY